MFMVLFLWNTIEQNTAFNYVRSLHQHQWQLGCNNRLQTDLRHHKEGTQNIDSHNSIKMKQPAHFLSKILY